MNTIIFVLALITTNTFAQEPNFLCARHAEKAAIKFYGKAKSAKSTDIGARFVSEDAETIRYQVEFSTQYPMGDYGTEEALDASITVVTLKAGCDILSIEQNKIEY